MERVIAGSANHTYMLHRNNWPLMVHTSAGAQRQGGWKTADTSEFLSICLSIALYMFIIRRKTRKKIVTEAGKTQEGRLHSQNYEIKKKNM